MFKLLRGLKPYTVPLTGMVFFLFAQSLAELYLPTLMAEVVNNGMLKGDTAYIWTFGGYMLLVALGSGLCSIIASYLIARIGMGFSRDTREKVFAQVESYSLHEFDQIGTASLITRTTNDITQVQNLLVVGLRFMVSAPIMCRRDYHGLFEGPAVNPYPGCGFTADAHLDQSLATLIIPLFKAMQAKLDQVNLVLRENLTVSR